MFLIRNSKTRKALRFATVSMVCSISYSSCDRVAASAKQRHVAHSTSGTGLGKQTFAYVIASDGFKVFRIREDGLLTPANVPTPYLGRYPCFAVAAPNGKGVYIGGIDDEYSTPSGYFERFHQTASGRLTDPRGASAEANPTAIVFGHLGRYAYVLSDTRLLGYSVSPIGTHKLLSSQPINVGASPSISADPLGRFLWVSRWNDKVIAAYKITATGALAHISDLHVMGRPGPVAWTPDGDTAYVAFPETGYISSVQIGRTGTPRLIESTKLSSGPQHVSLTVHPSGHFLYACFNRASSVKIIPIGPRDRLLVKKSASAEASGAWSLALDPTGKYAYVTGLIPGIITQFRVKPNGRLITLFPPVVSTGIDPVSMAIARP